MGPVQLLRGLREIIKLFGRIKEEKTCRVSRFLAYVCHPRSNCDKQVAASNRIIFQIFVYEALAPGCKHFDRRRRPQATYASRALVPRIAQDNCQFVQDTYASFRTELMRMTVARSSFLMT